MDNLADEATRSAAGEAAASPVRKGRRYVRQGEHLFELTPRAWQRLQRALAHGDAVDDLASYGRPLGPVQDLELLRKQPQAVAVRGRRRTTGRFETRDQLLERVWFYSLSTGLSDNAIADSVGVSPAVVSRILISGEGRPA